MHGFGLHPHNFVKVIEMTKEIHKIQILLNQKHSDPAMIRTKHPLIRSQMPYHWAFVKKKGLIILENKIYSYKETTHSINS